MEFYSRTNKPEREATPAGEKIVDTYALEVDKESGRTELVKNGKTNIYEKIQASKDETLIYNILERFNAGDVTALNKVQGVYGDFSNAPKTMAEAQQALINAESSFMSLPLEVRREFNMSIGEFLASANNGKLTDVLAKYTKQTETVEQPKEEGIKYE